tara:strand:- start:5534 stop:6226 length:693 start_codon:yes stop_codon:yes gene_type:complete
VIGISQSNYLPWKGYFDLINDCDIFVFLDEVQYTKQDWRNRNLIKTKRGKEWITIPIGKNIKKKIYEVKPINNHWQRKHKKSIQMAYSSCKFYREFEYILDHIYQDKNWESLSEFNQYTINLFCKLLNINTKIIDSREIKKSDDKNQRLIDIILKLKGNTYLSGGSAKSYLNQSIFQKNNIEIIWKDYSYYPIYPQKYNNFYHDLSIIDLVFNTGKDASNFIWGYDCKKL